MKNRSIAALSTYQFRERKIRAVRTGDSAFRRAKQCNFSTEARGCSGPLPESNLATLSSGKDDIPAYQLAVVVDDAAMGITEVVRGADLLRSTFRQLLLYRALELAPPDFYHLPLVPDEFGKRLAKRDDALRLRTLRAEGFAPNEIRRRFAPEQPFSVDPASRVSRKLALPGRPVNLQ